MRIAYKQLRKMTAVAPRMIRDKKETGYFSVKTSKKESPEVPKNMRKSKVPLFVDFDG